MKKIVCIFGDSYADPTYRKTNEYVSWSEHIQSLYNVHNFAKAGSGPDSQLQLFLSYIESNPADLLKKVSVIFFVSDIHRFNFKFFKNAGDQHLSTSIALDNKTDNSSELTSYKQYKNFTKQFFSEYVFNSSYQQTELTKILAFLQVHAYMFEKILVWPIFRNSQHFNHIKNRDNYYIVPNYLISIEGMDTDLPRNNHLTEPNHVIMLEQLCNWIDDNTQIDFDKFIKLT